jgi:hypothetical protein
VKSSDCFAASVVVLSVLFVTPAFATSAANRLCDLQYAKCLDNSDKCQNIERCAGRCSEKAVACYKANNTSGGANTNGNTTLPGGGKVGTTHPGTTHPGWVPTNNQPNVGVKTTGSNSSGGVIMRGRSR